MLEIWKNKLRCIIVFVSCSDAKARLYSYNGLRRTWTRNIKEEDSVGDNKTSHRTGS